MILDFTDLFMTDEERQLRKRVDNALDLYSRYSYEDTCMNFHHAESKLRNYLQQRQAGRLRRLRKWLAAAFTPPLIG